RRPGLSYERWRAVHLACTVVALAAAFAHVVWVDAYTSAPVVRMAVLGLVLAAAAALFWTRVARPYATALRRYRVVAVRRERGDAVTVELAADGHGGLRSQPGQFARLRAAHCAYGMDEHPFSLSSSARRPEPPGLHREGPRRLQRLARAPARRHGGARGRPARRGRPLGGGRARPPAGGGGDRHH